MQANVKQFILAAKQKVQEKNFQQALSEIEPALMLSKKNPEANMIGGYCYKELGLYEEASDCYKIVQEQKPNDPTLLKLMYELYLLTDKQKAKEYLEKLRDILIKANKMDKVAEIQVKLYEILLELKIYVLQLNQKDQVDQFFKDICENPLVKDDQKVSICLKHIESQVQLVNRINKENLKYISQKLRHISGGILDDLVLFIIEFYEQKYPITKIKASYLKVFELFDSYFITYSMLNKIYLFIQDRDIVLKLTLQLINFFEQFQENKIDKKISYFQEYYEWYFEQTRWLSKIFLLFVYEYLKNELKISDNDLIRLEKVVTQLNLIQDEIPDQQNNYILLFALNIKKLNQENQIREINILNQEIEKLNKIPLNVSKLEEISARISMNVITNPEHLVDIKNLLKLRIKQDNYDLQTLMNFYQYQMKICKMINSFDEELDIFNILDQILQRDQSSFILAEKAQFYLSNNKYQDLNEIEEMLQNSLQMIGNKPLIFKRLATLQFRKGAYDKCRNYLDLAIKEDPNDYQLYANLGILEYYQKGDYQKQFQKAFLLNHFDIHLNKQIFYCMAKNDEKQSIEFLERIYLAFQNVLWLNYILGIYYSNQGDFENAGKYLTKAIQIFSCKIDKNDLMNENQIGFKYIINQNKLYYLDDIILFGDKFYQQNAQVLDQNYFKQDQNKIKLWLQMAEINKNLGKISSASKCIDECEEILSQKPQILFKNKNEFNMKLAQIFQDCFLNDRPQQQPFIYEGLQDQTILILLQKSQMDFYMKKYYQSFQKLYQAIQIIDNKNFEIVNFILETGVDYIQKSYYGQSQGVAISMMQKLEEIVQMYTQQPIQNGWKEIADFYRLYGLIVQNVEYVEKSIYYIKQELLFKFGIDKWSGNVKIKNQIQQDLLCDLITNLLFLQKLDQKDRFQELKELVLFSFQLYPNSDKLWGLFHYVFQDQKVGAILKILSINKRNYQAVEQLGLIYFQQKNYESSLKLFQKSLEINPKSSISYTFISLICIIYALENQKRLQDTKITYLEKFKDFSKFNNNADIENKDIDNQNHLKEYINIFVKKAKSYVGFSNLYQYNQLALIIEQIIQQNFNQKLEFFTSPGITLQYITSDFWKQKFQFIQNQSLIEEQLKINIDQGIQEINQIWKKSTNIEMIKKLQILFTQIEIYILNLSKKQVNIEKRYIFQANKILTSIEIDFQIVDENSYYLQEIQNYYQNLAKAYLNLLKVNKELTNQFLNDWLSTQSWPFEFLNDIKKPCKFPDQLNYIQSMDNIRRNDNQAALKNLKLCLMHDPANKQFQQKFALFRQVNGLVIQKQEKTNYQNYKKQAVYEAFQNPETILQWIKQSDENKENIPKDIKNYLIKDKIINNSIASEYIKNKAVKIINQSNSKKNEILQKILQNQKCNISDIQLENNEKFYAKIVLQLYEKGFQDYEFYLFVKQFKLASNDEDTIIFLTVIQYMICAHEYFLDEGTFPDKVTLLQSFKDSADDCFDYTYKNFNLYFIYIHYCATLQKTDELESTLQTLGIYANYLNQQQEYLFNYFLIILHYQILTENPQESESLICFYDLFRYLEVEAGSLLKTCIFYLKGVVGLHIDSNQNSRMQLTKPFKLACLYQPMMAKSIISNLQENGYGEDDAIQDEMAQQVKYQQDLEDDLMYQQQMEDETEMMMEQMYQQFK